MHFLLSRVSAAPVIEGIVREREEHGEYTSLKTFVERNIDQINKRVVENLIKAGALDCLEGNRKQKMTIYTQIIDSINQDKKHTMAGQLSLFDIASEEDKRNLRSVCRRLRNIRKRSS